jgi:hypothetical protein
MDKKNTRAKIIKMLRRCVFGTARNVTKFLCTSEEEMRKHIKRLDLLTVAEIKRGKNNSVEIKFVDRLKALDKLCELMDSTDIDETENALYAAIEKSVTSGNKHGK